MSEAYRYFDTVLIDTGPVLGSVEASVLAQDVTGVLFTIARGQQPPLVERAMRHLNSLGASISGLVFNRANMEDFCGSEYSSSTRSVTVSSSSSQMAVAEQRCRFGPLVAAVLSSLPAASQPSAA
jgi:Mrp family chromosome partitioning ATPase